MIYVSFYIVLLLGNAKNAQLPEVVNNKNNKFKGNIKCKFYIQYKIQRSFTTKFVIFLTSGKKNYSFCFVQPFYITLIHTYLRKIKQYNIKNNNYI